MKLMDINKYLHRTWRMYGTMNNVVIAIALVIAASWAWGSISVMQRNFALQKEADTQVRQQQLTQLEVDTLKYQQNYYKSDEYKDLSARMYLGLASPGEKVLVLPPNSPDAKKDEQSSATPIPAAKPTAVSNLDQWLSFLMGANTAAYLQN